MSCYIATFFTHYDAIVFSRALAREQIKSQMMPVPRKLSSSCGTCVSFETDGHKLISLPTDELERLVHKADGTYIDLVDNR